MKYLKESFYIGAVILIFLPAVALADLQPGLTSPNSPPGLTSGNSVFTLPNPLNVGSFCGLILKLLNAIIAFGVPIAFLFLVYSGFLFITARGNDEKLNHAKRNFFYVIVGIGLFLGAWTFGQIVAATIKDLGGPDASQQCQ
jgi:hypothetical protein